MISFHKKKYDYDLIVLGSGGGGSVGAHYAESIGKKVAIFEPEDIGGECPNWACVPTKSLLHASKLYDSAKSASDFGVEISGLSLNYPKVKAWKDLVVARTGASHGEEAFRKERIHLIKEKAVFTSAFSVEAAGRSYTASKFLLATGSKEFIPPVPGLADSGYLTFREAVDLKKLPHSILILGGGAVGCEFAQVFTQFGAKVTLVNRSDRLLSKEDAEVGDLVKALFENKGVTVLTGTDILSVTKKGDKKVVHLKQNGHELAKEVDEILVSTGKVPVLNFAPEIAGIRLTNGKLHVNKYLQTSSSHIYAAGDLIGPYLFTHTANYQSYTASRNAFSNNKTPVDYRVVPRCVFLSPEVASVGISESDARQYKVRIKKGVAPIAVIGRANTSNEFDGFVKVLTNEKGVIIGASIVAPRAGEMIHELALAIQLRAKAIDLANMIHAYPTYSEAIKVACSIVE